MKKVLFVLLFLPLQVFAISGACSDHGGVMCSVGPDTDDSVVCNDYWSDSTVNYYASDECTDYLCPAQQVLRQALIEKAEETGALDVGTSSLCDQIGGVTYANLEICLALRNEEIAQTWAEINSIVASARYTCYENELVADPPSSYTPPSSLLPASTTSLSDVFVYTDHQEAINYVYTEGIVSGYPDGTFKPNNQINRAEFTKILIGAKFGRPNAELDNQCFPDVPKGQWFTPYVCSAKEKGIIGGYPDGAFKPDQTINQAEAYKIIVNTFSLSGGVTGANWYDEYVAAMQTNYALAFINLDVAAPLLRGEMAQLIYNIIK